MNASTSKNWPPDGAAKQSAEYKENSVKTVNYIKNFHQHLV